MKNRLYSDSDMPGIDFVNNASLFDSEMCPVPAHVAPNDVDLPIVFDILYLRIYFS